MLDGGVYNQFVYSPSGKLLARMNAQTVVSVRVLLPGAWAVYSSINSFNHYEHVDWLGNTRLSSNQNRTMASDIAYAPFGEAYASTSTVGVSFTGMRSDVAGVSGATTNGLYDFLARELPPTQGRWLSPDPAGVLGVNRAGPQSWNRYAYVFNNPLGLIDPLGLCPDYNYSYYDSNGVLTFHTDNGPCPNYGMGWGYFWQYLCGITCSSYGGGKGT